MCVKLPPKDFNPGPCLPHPTSTYTCGVIIAPRVRGDILRVINTKVNVIWHEIGKNPNFTLFSNPPKKKKKSSKCNTYSLSFTTFHCSSLSLYLAISVLQLSKLINLFFY